MTTLAGHHHPHHPHHLHNQHHHPAPPSGGKLAMSQRHGRHEKGKENSGPHHHNHDPEVPEKPRDKNAAVFVDLLPVDQSRIEGDLEFAFGNQPYAPRFAALKQATIILSRFHDDPNAIEIDMNAVEGLTYLEDPRLLDVGEGFANQSHPPRHLHSTFRRGSMQHEGEGPEDVERTPSANSFPRLRKTKSLGRKEEEEPLSTDCLHDVSELEVVLLTYSTGFYRGHPIRIKLANLQLKDMWMESIRRVLRAGNTLEASMTSTEVFRKKLQILYKNENTQLVVAFLITGNFLINIMDAQVKGAEAKAALAELDNTFTYLFTVELLVNMVANLVVPFFSDGWNYFDGIVVLVSWLSMSTDSLPGGNVLKLLRTVRVFRLFKRIPSLHKMVSSLQRALPSMGQAYILVCILLAIFTILAVTFFRELKPDYFEGFFAAAFSLWQIMTGDDWSVVVRELMADAGSSVLVALFFVVFQLIITFTLVNVFVCVLVDDFCSPEGCENKSPKPCNPSDRDCLTSLLYELMMAYDAENLHARMMETWTSVCGSAGKLKEAKHAERGVLDFQELRLGLKQLEVFPPVALSVDDWYHKIADQGLCDSEGRVSRSNFFQLIRASMFKFERDNLALLHAENQDWNSDSIYAALCVLKWKSLRVAERSRSQEILLMEDERGGASTARRKQNSQGKSQVEVMLTSVVREMNRLHQRFNQVEAVITTKKEGIRENRGFGMSYKRLPGTGTAGRMMASSFVTSPVAPRAPASTPVQVSSVKVADVPVISTGNTSKLPAPARPVSARSITVRSANGEGDSSDLSGATTQHSPQVHQENQGLNLQGIANLFSPPAGGNLFESLWGANKEASR